MLRDLNGYLGPAIKLEVDEFVSRFPYPVLVIQPFAPVEATRYETATQGGVQSGKQPSVATLVKRDGANAFPAMITIGRTPNNDVVIPAARVSKFHAYVTLDPEGEVKLSDAGSTYGTFVGEDRLEPRSEHRVLQSGTIVRLGEDVQACFYTSLAFYEFFQTKRSQ